VFEVQNVSLLVCFVIFGVSEELVGGRGRGLSISTGDVELKRVL
jgi:hypothetical protein